MKYINDGNYPDAIFKWLTTDTYDRGDSDYSITQLIDSPRIRLLNKIYDDEIEINASEMMASRLGTEGHNGIERHDGHDEIAEERIHVVWKDIKISGAVDLQADKTLIDNKFCKAYAVIFGKIEWERQLNGYAWLIRSSSFVEKIKRLQIAAFIVDWNKSEAERVADYPDAAVMMIDVPLWSFEEQEEYFQERIRLHSVSELSYMLDNPDDLPFCTDEERWKRPSKFAVMKGKNKRAVKLHDTKEEAEEHAEKDKLFWVEERPAVPVRCEKWCRVSKWCNQYQEELNNDG